MRTRNSDLYFEGAEKVIWSERDVTFSLISVRNKENWLKGSFTRKEYETDMSECGR